MKKFKSFLKNLKSFFKGNFHFFISLGGLVLLTLIFLILITLAAIETKRPTAYTDVALKTTGNGDAFDNNSATFSTTSYNATHNPSIIYYGWTAAGQIYTALDLKLTYSADAATNDTYAYYYSTSGATNCSDYTTRSWSTLLSPTSAGAPQTTLTQALSASQDLTQLCIKIATAKTGSPDNKNVYTHEIWTEGTYTINNPPSATTPASITQAINGSGYITFSTTVSDPDSNETRLKVEYSDNGGATWYDPDLFSATPSSGSVDMDNANIYQIGTVDGIDTDNFGSITLTIVWNTKSALNGGGSLDNTNQSDIQIRVTPYDGIVNGTTQASSSFQVDNLSPAVTDANISIAGGMGTLGAYKIGDTITATWNNSAGGDNNSGLSAITANLFPWGGSATAAMTDTTACGGTAANNIYEACYTIIGTEGKDADNQNTSITATDSFGNFTTTSDTTNAKIDTIAPAGLTALVVGATGSTTQTLNWTAVTEISFDHYEIWYGTNQSNVQNRTGGAVEWDNSDDVNLATRTTTTTTITGLSPSTLYYFKIWAIDDVGNEETVADINTTTTAPANNPPSATTPASVSQYTNGSGYLSFQTTVSDADSNNTKLKVEYSDDGGGTWKDPDLISATPGSGTVDLDDANPYQIGTVDAIDTSAANVTLTIVWDTKSALNDGGSSNLNNTDQSDIQVRVTPNDGTVNGSAQASANFSIDNLNPSGLTALTAGATGTTTQVLNWSAVTENNFNHYEIWYGTNQTDVINRTGTASEWDNVDDSALATISTTTTTITGLSSSTTYYFKIWAIDNFGNEQTVSDINTTTGSGNSAPSATIPFSITQATNGSGYITFSTTISDPDSNKTKLKIEYSDNGGSTWYDPDLVSATPNNGAIDLNDANTYQIGTGDGIDTDGFANVTLVVVWDTKSALNGGGSLDGTDQSDIKIRVTPNDGTIDGSASASANFSLDNLSPSGLAALIIGATTSVTQVLSWSAVTETNFDHYEIWYGTNQTDVANRSGTAVEWDNVDDINLATISTTTTTITGLTEDTTYYYKIWAIDDFGNEHTVATSSKKTNHKPAISGTAGVQQTDDGYVNITYTLADNDSNTCSLSLYEYSLDNSTWFTMTAATGDLAHDGVSGLTSSPAGISHTFVWNAKADVNSTYDATVYVRLRANDGVENGDTNTSASFTLDVKNPIGLASFAGSSAAANSITWTWTAVTDENNFNHYEIWYGTNQTDVANRTGTAIEWDNSDDIALATQATATTTITGLASSTLYYAKIWAVDNYQNEATTTGASYSTQTPNSAPSATTPSSITQATNGSGYITFSTTISDPDSNETKLKIEYSDNGGVSWYDPDLVSATPNNGLVDLNNANTYQVGTANGIDTDNFASATLTIVWNTKSASNGNGSLDNTDQSDIKIRVTPNDGTIDGTIQTSANFQIDNLDPAVTAVNVFIRSDTCTGTGGACKNGNSPVLRWDGNLDGEIDTITSAVFNGSQLKSTDSALSGSNLGLNIWETLLTGVLDSQEDIGNTISVIVTDDKGNSTGPITSSTSYIVDTVIPTAPGSLTNSGTKTSTSITLNFGSVGSDGLFGEYKIFYKANTGGVTESNSPWTTANNPNLGFANYNSATSTTVTGLNASTNYFFNIWIYDQAGNKSNASELGPIATDSGNSAPSATTPSSISQATNGSGYITFSTTITDADSNETKLKIEYSDNGGTTWYDPDLFSATPNNGATDFDDANAYQVGTVNGIDTDNFANVTLTIVWNTKSALNGGGSLDSTDQSDIKIRVMPNDGVIDGSASASANFSVDNLDPTGLTALASGTTTPTTQILNWSAVTENNFDHYEIWYGQNQSDVQGRAGTASEWDNVDDSALATILTTTTTIIGLSASTTYYLKIWAIDDFGNEATVADINAATLSAGQVSVPSGGGTVDVTTTQTEAVFSSSTDPAVMNIPASVNNATLNLDNLVDNITGTGTLPSIVINSSTSVGNVNIEIPANINIDAGGAWNGIMNAPQVQANNSVNPGSNTTVEAVIEIGFSNTALAFNQAVRMRFANQAGKRAGYSRNNIFTEITNTCSADTQAAGNALPANGDCKINVGDDLVVWTKHFTGYVIYITTAAPPAYSPPLPLEPVKGVAKETIYDYQYISQSVNPTLKPEESATLTLTIKNTGNTPWSKSGMKPTRLGTSHPNDRISSFYHSSWISGNRVALKQDTVAPGEIGTFEFTIQAPSNIQLGIYREYFTPVVESITWMKDAGIYWEITIGEKISKEIIPINYGFYIVAPNDTLGKIAVKLGATVDRLIELNKDRFPALATRRDVISVGWELRYELLVPAVPEKPIEKYDYQYISQSPYPTINPGETAILTLTLKNTGNIPWYKSGLNPIIRLGTSNPQDRISSFYHSSSWLSVNRIALKQDKVDPGEIGSFEFIIQAPLDIRGVFKENFTPVIDGLAWMKDMGIYWEITTGIKIGFYTVASGDTLGKIAVKLGTTVDRLIELNKDRFPALATRRGVILVGWELKYEQPIIKISNLSFPGSEQSLSAPANQSVDSLGKSVQKAFDNFIQWLKN